MSFRLIPKSVTLNDLERRNSPNLCVISPNSVAFGTDYVKVVGDIPRGVYPPTAMTQPFPLDYILSAPLVFLPSPPLSRESGGLTPGKFFEITDARRRVLRWCGGMA